MLAVITLYLTPLRTPDPGSRWSSLLAGWIHDSKAQDEHSSGPKLDTPGWYHHLSVAWKIVLPDWLKGMQNTDVGR